MSQRKTIFMTGMFDLDNYGDLLFPLIASHRLSAHGFDVVPVAPSERRATLDDAPTPVDISQLLLNEQPICGVLIGGGYIIHASSLDFIERYHADVANTWSGAGLWLGATLAAALRETPIAWNAPGAPHPFSSRQRKLVRAAVRAATYASVRDQGSASLLGPDPSPIRVVPDPIAEIATLWPKRSLSVTYRQVIERKGLAADVRLMAVHVRNRSIRGLDPGEFGAMLAAFAKAEGLTPALIGIGAGHDDPAVARELAPHIGQPLLLLDDPASLREITAILSHSALYVGASLHGYVAASAYGVPGVMIGRPAYQKFAGFLEHTGRMQDLAKDWKSAIEDAPRALREPPGPRIPPSVFAALDDHWEAIRSAFTSPDRRREARREFLAALLQTGIDREGLGWAMSPFVNRVTRGSASQVAP